MILAFSGWKGSGKDTCADYFVNRYGYKRISFADRLKDAASANWDVPRTWFDNRTKKEKALEQYPAYAEDAWSKSVVRMLFRHLRSIYDQEPQSYAIVDGKVMGVFHKFTWVAWLCATLRVQGPCSWHQLYHTPRSIGVNTGLSERVIDPEVWVRKAFYGIQPGDKLVISDLRLKSEARCIKKIGAHRGGSQLIRLQRFKSTTDTDASERDLDDYPFDRILENCGTIDDLLRDCDRLITM